MDTIFALATASGKSGVAIVRLSGSAAHDAVRKLCGDVPQARLASLRKLFHPDGTLLDEALILVFQDQHSFTGEESAELHLHGSMAIVAAVLDVLAGFEGVRLAQPGEFTRRAMENGKLDLSQVEGLADLIDAETEGQRRQALRVFSGELGKKAEEWRSKLIRAAALLEATIDFADEEVPTDVGPEVRELISSVLDDLNVQIKGVHVAERIRDGFEVAIVGAPNVGKSTLLNALAGRDAAITSATAGTTRDVIEVRMDLGGLPVTLLDTAGIRDAVDEVEQIGIDRARSRAAGADLRVFLTGPDGEPDLPCHDGDIVLVGKIDAVGGTKAGLSGLTGEGVSELVEQLTEILSKRSSGAGVAVKLRHKEAMQRGKENLIKSVEWLHAGDFNDLAAEELRSAVRALDSLVGRVDIENILDEIFSSFCLGK